jgi:hypothetical protein
MFYYQVHLYFQTKQQLYDPIQGQNIIFSGSVLLPLLYEQLNKLNIYINQNNFSQYFSKLTILNTKQVDIKTFEALNLTINKNNYLLINAQLPMYHIISFIENIIT